MIISDDNPTNAAAAPTAVPPFIPGALNGAVFRLGALRTSGLHDYLYELQPGYDISSTQASQFAAIATANAAANVDVFILGRQLQDPNKAYSTVAPVNLYDGPVQDVAVQTFSLTAPHP